MLFFGVIAAQAQGGGQRGQGGQGQRMDPEAMAKQRAEMFQEKFGLSDDQYTKTYDALLTNQKDLREKMSALMGSGDREGMRAAAEKGQADLDVKLKEIFTAEQFTKYEAWKKENPPMQRRRGGGN